MQRISDELGGRERALGHVTTDKPLYRPGETLYGAVVVLDAFERAPWPEPVWVAWELRGPKGDPVTSGEGATEGGVAAFNHAFAADAPGGSYTLVASFPRSGFPAAERELELRAYRPPRLRSQLEFVRKAYGPGDVVDATLVVTRAEGGVPVGAEVEAVATVDGAQVHRERLRLDGEGRCALRFTLPAAIERGEGTLAAIVRDGGVQETAARSIPLVIEQVALDFYPEGGDLVVGLEGRVYLEARRKQGKPADVAGRVLDGKGRVVATFRSEHEGRGSFVFRPDKAGRSYFAALDEPQGVDELFPLPAAVRGGYALSAEGAGLPGGPVALRVAASAGGPARVALFQREREVASLRLELAPGEARALELTPPELADGVLRATLFDAQGVPRAERLVFRQPVRRLEVEVQVTPAEGTPRAPVTVEVQVRDAEGRGVRALGLVAVSDDAVLETQERRERPPRLPAQVLLEPEVTELRDAAAYLADEEEAPARLDLLLGTQGWRRFLFFPPLEEQDEETAAAARRAQARRTPPEREPDPGSGAYMLGGFDDEPPCFGAGEDPFAPRGAGAPFGGDPFGGGNPFAPPGAGPFGAAVDPFAGPPGAAADPFGGGDPFAAPGAADPFGGGDPFAAPGAADPFGGGGDFGGDPFAAPPGAAAAAFGGGDPFAAPPRAAADPFGGGPAFAAAAPRAFAPPPAAPPPFAPPPAGRPAFFGAPAAPPPGPPPMAAAFAAPALPPRGWDDPDDGEVLDPGEEVMLDVACGGPLLEPKLDEDERFDPFFAQEEALEPEPLDLRPRRGAVAWLARFQGPPRYERQYAHEAQRGRAERSDFRETLYWEAGCPLAPEGQRLRFELADSLTSYRVRVDAVGEDGALGSGEALIEVRQPFYLEPKLPLELTAGDRVLAPVALSNGTAARLEVELEVDLEAPLELRRALEPVAVAPQARARCLLPLAVGRVARRAEARVRVGGRARGPGQEPLRDQVARAVPLVPAGFPRQLDHGGRLEQALRFRFTLPDSLVPGSLIPDVVLYPSPLANLAEAVEALLREPYGCFEQTSSSTYPNVMVLQYLATHSGADPRVGQRATKLIETGYERLTGYEVEGGGFEWFGAPPAHEALTAYGLLEFTDMARVYPIDLGLLERTREWLLSRRTGQGGYERNRRALDSFGSAPQEVTDLYVTWALTEAYRAAGEESDAREALRAELRWVEERARGEQDLYCLALAANALLGAGLAADDALARLAAAQGADGALNAPTRTITCSGTRDAAIETTALAALAWLRAPRHAVNAQRGVDWILSTCEGGRFGATQATVLALKAIVERDLAASESDGPRELRLLLDGAELERIEVPAGAREPVRFADFSARCEAGEHELELRLSGPPLPASFSLRFSDAQPPSSDACRLTLRQQLSRAEVPEGEPVDLDLWWASRADEPLAMSLAIVGLPGGLEPRTDQLRELVEAGAIAMFELRGRELILYRRGFAPREEQRLTISLLAAVPGSYTGPASRTYLYYDDRAKQWVAPLEVSIPPVP
ncbi:MAG: MG2 domain-containing protein [Planctomycetota bacterium]